MMRGSVGGGVSAKVFVYEIISLYKYVHTNPTLKKQFLFNVHIINTHTHTHTHTPVAVWFFAKPTLLAGGPHIFAFK